YRNKFTRICLHPRTWIQNFYIGPFRSFLRVYFIYAKKSLNIFLLFHFFSSHFHVLSPLLNDRFFLIIYPRKTVGSKQVSYFKCNYYAVSPFHEWRNILHFTF